MNVVSGELIGLITQSGLFGMYVLLNAVAIYCLYWVRGKKVMPNKVVVVTSLLSFITTSMFYVLSVVRVLHAFIDHPDDVAGTLMSLEQAYIVRLLRNTVYCTSIMLMDAMLVYRLYIIYMRNVWIIVFPVLAILGYIASTCAQVILLSRADYPHIGAWIISATVLSMVVSSYCTFLIIHRILREGRAFEQFGTRNIFLPVLHITVESALLSSVLVAVSFLLYLVSSGGGTFLFLHLVPPLIGINYTIILIRIGLGFTNPTMRTTMRQATTRGPIVFHTPTTHDKSQHSIAFNASQDSESSESAKCHKTFDTSLTKSDSNV